MRICWADDAREEAESFSSVFSSVDAEIEFATDGRKALDAIQVRSFDLVITDLRMAPSQSRRGEVPGWSQPEFPLR